MIKVAGGHWTQVASNRPNWKYLAVNVLVERPVADMMMLMMMMMICKTVNITNLEIIYYFTDTIGEWNPNIVINLIDPV